MEAGQQAEAAMSKGDHERGLTARHLGRRELIMGVIGGILGACAPRERRLDVEATRTRLEDAVQACDGYVSGRLQLQDSAQTGTVLTGVLAVRGTDRPAVTASFSEILEATARSWQGLEDPPSCDVRVESHAEDDPALVVTAVEAIGAAPGSTVTTEDLVEHFGL